MTKMSSDNTKDNMRHPIPVPCNTDKISSNPRYYCSSIRQFSGIAGPFLSAMKPLSQVFVVCFTFQNLITISVQRTIVPEHYALWVVPFLHNLTYQGRVSVNFTVPDFTDQITLNSENLNINSFVMRGLAQRDMPQPEFSTGQNLTHWFISAKQALRGRYNLDISFTGRITDIRFGKGFYYNTYIDDESEALIVEVLGGFSVSTAVTKPADTAPDTRAAVPPPPPSPPRAPRQDSSPQIPEPFTLPQYTSTIVPSSRGVAILTNLPGVQVAVVNTAISDHYGQQAIINGHEPARDPTNNITKSRENLNIKMQKRWREHKPGKISCNSFLMPHSFEDGKTTGVVLCRFPSSRTPVHYMPYQGCCKTSHRCSDGSVCGGLIATILLGLPTSLTDFSRPLLVGEPLSTTATGESHAKSKSTIYAVVSLVNMVIEELERYTLSVFLDKSKSFDFVDKLKSHAIRRLKSDAVSDLTRGIWSRVRLKRSEVSRRRRSTSFRDVKLMLRLRGCYVQGVLNYEMETATTLILAPLFNVLSCSEYVATTSRARDNYRTFPCFDEPALRSPFTVHIARFLNQSSQSNMPLASTSLPESSLDGRVWDTYHDTPYLSTHEIHLSVHSLSRVNSARHGYSVLVSGDSAPQAAVAAALLPTTADLLQMWLLDLPPPLPLPKMDILVLPDITSGTSLSPGIVTCSEDHVLLMEGISNPSSEQLVVHTVANTVSYQWFSLHLIPEGWLRDGVATYLQYKLASQLKPSWRFDELFTLDILHEIFVEELDVPNSVENVSPLLYKKVAVTLRMVESFATEDVVRRSLRRFIDRRILAIKSILIVKAEPLLAASQA
ncbi:hypothetical protein J6590_086433 [Homalodisca vitripennis]|nr:hypothetical protein J6590_086433 [Homalodisca vitripennis]